MGTCLYYRRTTGVALIIDPLQLEIIYHDNHLVAINKPPGLLVHRTKIANDASEFALQLLRDQLDQHVFPCHRLDRKTSGVLLFAKDESSNRIMQKKFADGQIAKKYMAIVRGYTPDKSSIDYPLKSEKGTLQPAITNFNTIDKTEINIPSGNQLTSRYSLVSVEPQTGRMHQIRKHFAHIFHPIIGDRPHGCNKQNRLFKEKWQMDTMMLHAYSLKFQHPYLQSREVNIIADLFQEFNRVQNLLEFNENYPSKLF